MAAVYGKEEKPEILEGLVVVLNLFSHHRNILHPNEICYMYHILALQRLVVQAWSAFQSSDWWPAALMVEARSVVDRKAATHSCSHVPGCTAGLQQACQCIEAMSGKLMAVLVMQDQINLLPETAFPTGEYSYYWQNMKTNKFSERIVHQNPFRAKSHVGRVRVGPPRIHWNQLLPFNSPRIAQILDFW